MLSKKAFMTGLAMLQASFGTPEHLETPQAKKLMMEAMQDMSDEDFLDGVNHCRNSCKFFPKPVEIRQVANQKSMVMAEDAWMMVRDKAGDFRGMDCSDLPPIVQKAINSMGGMDRIKSMNWENYEEIIKRDFIGTYKDMQDSAARDPEYLNHIDSKSLLSKHGSPQAIGSVLGGQKKQIQNKDPGEPASMQDLSNGVLGAIDKREKEAPKKRVINTEQRKRELIDSLKEDSA